MRRAVGIDLGTTNSAIAVVDDYGRPVILPNHLGQPITPSVVCFRNGAVCVGAEAKELQGAGDPSAVAFFKRQMGNAAFVFHEGGRDYSAIDLSGLVLGKLKADAEAALGHPVADAVVTVPAYFRNPEREATKAAGRKAGLNVLQVINEPTAAAIAYGLRPSTGKDEMILVYDLGGGTFDVTLLRITPEEIRVLSSTGDHELGGKDWDDRIVQHLAEQYRLEHGLDPFADATCVGDLLVRAEEAKKRLTVASSATVSITHAGRTGRYELDRATFEQLTADLMHRTVGLTREVLQEQEVQPEQLDGILLVGGATRMPMVHDFITRAFGGAPMTGVNVDEAVALGAAVVASGASTVAKITAYGLPGRVRTVDVTNHSLGMIAVDAEGTAYVNSIILPKNRPIPCSECRPYQFRTRDREDNRVEIFMTQGETQSLGDVTYLGMYVLHDIPHQSTGPTVVDVEYQYDISGTVEVRGRLRSSGTALRLTVEPLPPDVPDRFLRPPEKTTVGGHVTAYLAFDLSGSMAGRPLQEAKRAALGFLANVDLARCSVGILSVADRVSLDLEACQDAKAIERAIGKLQVGTVGFGNFGEPFSKAKQLLEVAAGAGYLIVLADGVWCGQDRAIQRAQACHATGIGVIAIGFGSADKRFLRAVASTDEASFFTSLEGLVSTFTTIAQVLTETGGEVGPEEQDSRRRMLLRGERAGRGR
jgi:molecular chaperone DnaK (HSP70)